MIVAINSPPVNLILLSINLNNKSLKVILWKKKLSQHLERCKTADSDTNKKNKYKTYIKSVTPDDKYLWSLPNSLKPRSVAYAATLFVKAKGKNIFCVALQQAWQANFRKRNCISGPSCLPNPRQDVRGKKNCNAEILEICIQIFSLLI